MAWPALSSWLALSFVKLITILKKKLVFKKKKKKHKKKKKTNRQPCMGMASVVVDSMGDVATIVVVGVFMARVVSALVI